MKTYFPGSVYERAPVGQWYVVLKEHFLERSFDVYLLCDTEDGRRIACSGQWFQVVDEGAEPPMWLELASEQALDDTGVLNAFKHVYVIQEQLQRLET